MFVAHEWDESGRQVDPRDVPPPAVSRFAQGNLPRYVAVLNATSIGLDERDQLDLLSNLTGCKATLDWLQCRTLSSLVCKDNGRRRQADPGAAAPADNEGPSRRLSAGHAEMRQLGGEGTPEVCEFLIPEVALELSCSERAASDHLAVSLDLRFRLPSTNATLGGGLITLAHARVISEATRCLSEEAALELDERLAEAATERTPSRLRVLARRCVARLDPDGFRRRHRKAFEERSTTVFPTADGMAAFCLNHQLETLAVIDDQLDAWARRRCALDPETSFAAHKADAAAHLLLGQHPIGGAALVVGASRDTAGDSAGDRTDPPVPADPGEFLPARTELRVTMSADTLIGLDDSTCALEGYGPLTADQARRLVLSNCGSTMVRRVFTDPADDSVMFLDAQRYQFLTPQKHAILAMHPMSCFPGATTPGEHCDLDHRRPYVHGPPHAGADDSADPPGQASDPSGQTVVPNGQPLGRRHHRLKTHGGWTCVVDEDDPHTIIWTSPRGRVHVCRDHDGA
jgi:Domain of unknown function (DUF222)